MPLHFKNVCQNCSVSTFMLVLKFSFLKILRLDQLPLQISLQALARTFVAPSMRSEFQMDFLPRLGKLCEHLGAWPYRWWQNANIAANCNVETMRLRLVSINYAHCKKEMSLGSSHNFKVTPQLHDIPSDSSRFKHFPRILPVWCSPIFDATTVNYRPEVRWHLVVPLD